MVDILIPVYNGAEYIRSSIESIQGQTLRDICIHVVDDGSTDATGRILADMAAEDPRIIVHSKPNGGIVDALNHGLACCTSEFVARHDADDLAYPTRLEEQVALLRSRGDIVAVGGSARHIDPAGKPIGTVARFQSPDKADVDFVPAREPYLLHPFLMIRRQALIDIGGYRYVIHAEDADLYWRLHEKGGLHNDPRIQGEYRMHPDSVSSQSVRNGRVMAISSQLCAISAMRRRAGCPDLAFTFDDGVQLKAASSSLESACAVASRDLTENEARHLRFAAGVKLLEMAGYRPYEIEMSDCLFLRKAWAESFSRLGKVNGGMVRRNYSGTAARLARLGHWEEARALLPPGSALTFYWRYLLRIVLSPKTHHHMRQMVGPVLRLVRG